jgi:hypothetical protein
MRKAARTVKPNARTGERHTWKDRERRRKEERQRMAAEALIVEDAYQRGYADAIADMRKKKEQRRQREQAKKARRWYFIKQKAYGLAMLAVTVLAAWATEGDITIAVITVPLGLMCLFSKKMLIVDNYYFATEERAIHGRKKQYSVLKSCKHWQSGAFETIRARPDSTV